MGMQPDLDGSLHRVPEAGIGQYIDVRAVEVITYSLALRVRPRTLLPLLFLPWIARFSALFNVPREGHVMLWRTWAVWIYLEES